jgi:saccharopine dehydrogenase (NADP+, L-glutamate forming)
MLHEFEYAAAGRPRHLRSRLVVKGENSLRTAMAKTVGLPLGIAARLILENRIRLKGLHIPIIPEIYDPVLHELELQGIRFEETVS